MIKSKYDFIKTHGIKSYEFYEEIYNEVLDELKTFNNNKFKSIKANIVEYNNHKKCIIAYVPKELSLFFKQYIIMTNYNFIETNSKYSYPIYIHYEIEGEKEKIAIVHNLKCRDKININFILSNGIFESLLESYKKYILCDNYKSNKRPNFISEKEWEKIFKEEEVNIIKIEKERLTKEVKKLVINKK